MNDDRMTKDDMWDALESLGVPDEALQIITSINGYTRETLLNVLYAHTGCRAFHQIED